MSTPQRRAARCPAAVEARLGDRNTSAAQETRSKIEKIGLKTYTQVTETAAGNRIRVRLGPFATREEAERVLAKAKSAGVNGVVLTL